MKSARPLTPLELALLGLIHQRTSSGYDLCKIFETTPMGHYSSSPGAIYPALKRLEERGLLVGQVERIESMRPRRIYDVAPEGQKALLEWVSREVTHDDLVWRSDELILRFGFMGQLVDRRVICPFLKQVVTLTDTLIAGLEAHHATMLTEEQSSPAPATGRLALEHGIESYRGLARWARRAFNELNNQLT